MPGAGETLRQTRESLGFSPDEVARETHIRVEYLDAIENDDYAALPGDVYTRGFLRNYAAFLGLNAADIINSYEGGNAAPRKRLIGPPAPPPRRGPEPIRIQPLSPVPVDTRVRYAPSFWLIGLLVFVLLIAGYLAMNVVNGSTRLPLVATPTSVARATPTELLGLLPSVVVGNTPVWTPFPTPGPGGPATRVAVVPAPATAVPPPAAASGQAPTAAPPANGAPSGDLATVVAQATAIAQTPPSPTPTTGQGVTVQVTIGSENAWVRVDLDGRTNFQGTLPAGSSRAWTGQSHVRIRTGRGDLVSINVNGVDKGLMSDAAQMVVTKEWDAAGNERVVQ